MSSIVRTIAAKEIRDAFRSRLLVALIVLFVVMIGLSLSVANFNFRSAIDIYNHAVQQLKDSGQAADAILAKPRYFPLLMLQNTIEYIEIVGAVLAIILGYLSLAKERTTNTLQLVLSRPVSRPKLVAGKLLGNAVVLLLLTLGINVFAYIAVWVIGSAPLSSTETLKLALASFCALLYLIFFYCLGSALASTVKSLPNALILALAIWVVFVLILPQIGDTMDVDNQVPGGFFSTLHLTGDQGNIILKQFGVYETIRNTTEITSITKHYERSTFALLGIKEQFNGKGFDYIFARKWQNMVSLIGFVLGGILVHYLAFVRSKQLWRNE